jgi:hypothetical protein
MPKRVEKRLLEPGRVRRIAGGFAWLDRRFVHEGWIERLPKDGVLLYLFLVAVTDRQGLSYYSDRSICGLLKIDVAELEFARSHLVDLQLVAHEPPLYQVLDLPSVKEPRRAESQPVSIAEVLRQAARNREPAGS